MDKITTGDIIMTKHGPMVILGIEMVEPGQSDGGIEMSEIWACDKDRCVFDLPGERWTYGYECQVIEPISVQKRPFVRYMKHHNQDPCVSRALQFWEDEYSHYEYVLYLEDGTFQPLTNPANYTIYPG